MKIPVRKTDDGCLTTLCLSDKQVPSLVVGYDNDFCCSFVSLEDLLYLLKEYGYQIIKTSDVSLPEFEKVRQQLIKR